MAKNKIKSTISHEELIYHAGSIIPAVKDELKSQLARITEIERIVTSGNLTFSDSIPLNYKLVGVKGEGVYVVEHKYSKRPIYIGMGKIGSRVNSFRNSASGVTKNHIGGRKAHEYDSDLKNYTVKWIKLESAAYMAALEARLMYMFKPLFTDDKMAGK